MRRSTGRSPRGPCVGEWLEARNLPAAGLAGLVNELRDLGAVSVQAAASGVEVTATVPAHASITFRFDVEDSGHYLLLVRHDGDDFGLTAKGPSGSAAIDPGPEGPLTTVPLTLRAATYDVKAAARGDHPVFVDWEFLIVTGIGQSAAIATSLAVPSTLGPAPTSAQATAPVAASAQATAPASIVASPASPATIPVASAASAFATIGPVGHPGADPGPTGPARAIASARPVAGRFDPSGVVADPPAPEDFGAAMLARIEGVSREESSTTEEIGPWGDLAGFARAVLSPGDGDPKPDGAEPEGRSAALAGISPDMIGVAVVVAIASRKRSSRDKRARWVADPSRAGWSNRPHFRPQVRSNRGLVPR